MRTAAQFILLSCLLFYTVQSDNVLSLHLPHGDTRCVSKLLDEKEALSFRLSAVSDTKNINAQIVHVTVKSHDGKIMAEEMIHVSETQQFLNILAIAESRGVCKMCCEYTHSEGHYERNPVKIHFDMDSNRNQGPGSDEKKRKKFLPSVQSELLAAENILFDMGTEFESAKRQEMMLQEISESTASNIIRMSCVSIAVLVLTTIWQLVYLRRFFNLKKIL